MNFSDITTDTMIYGTQYVTADNCKAFNQQLIDQMIYYKITILILVVLIIFIMVVEILKKIKK